MAAIPLIIHDNTSHLDRDSYASQVNIMTEAQILSTYGLTVPSGNYAKIETDIHSSMSGSYYYQFVNAEQFASGIPYSQIEHSDLFSIDENNFFPLFEYMPKTPIQVLVSKYLNVSGAGVTTMFILIPCFDVNNNLPEFVSIGSNIDDPLSSETNNVFTFGTSNIDGSAQRISKNQMENVYGITDYTGWSENAVSNPDAAWDVFAQFQISANAGELVATDTPYYIRLCMASDLVNPDYDNIRALTKITVSVSEIANGGIHS